MASKFRILIHPNGSNLHMKLMGDFDGSSAYQVLNQLQRHCSKFSTIFVHTDSLKQVIPFGAGVFQRNLKELRKGSAHLIFTGHNAEQLSS